VIPSQSIIRTDLDQIREDLGPDVLSRLAGRRLLITGGAGFLGYYLVHTVANWNLNAAPADRIDLIVCDNLVRGTPAWLARIEKAPSVRLVVADASQPLSGDLGPFDWIIHAAGIASPMVYRRLPLETMDANINGLRWLLVNDLRSALGVQRRPTFAQPFGISPSEVLVLVRTWLSRLPRHVGPLDDFQSN
jgi:hypothetical protein